MKTHIRKWGNSLGLRIPKPLARMAQIEKGSEVELQFVDDFLQIRPVRKREYSLATLLADVSEENIHTEVDTGEAVGKESW